jgi:hypothetical protein
MADPAKPLLERVKPYAEWIYRGISIIIIGALVVSWWTARSSKEALSKELEREKIEKAELLAEKNASKKELSQREKELLMGNADLEVEVARLKDVLGTKPKIIEVIKWQTAPVDANPATDGRTCPPVEPGGKPMGVLFAEGDKGHAEAIEMTYETKENNHVIVGKVTCFRDTPTPFALFSSILRAPLSSAIALPEAPLPSWGFGGYVGFSENGAALGPSVAFPPLRIFSTQLEVTGGVGLGAKMSFQGGLTAILRK